MSSQEETSTKIPSYKVVLIGETAVGKTSLISRFTKNTFTENFSPTLGGSFLTKSIKIEQLDDKEIKFEIWDTAGQEKYRSIAKMFYKDAAVAILVYDITRRDSLNEIQNYWFNEVKENGSENIIIALAGNKSDLYEYEEVGKDEVTKFAEENNIIFKETSAKENNGVDDLFNLIGIKLVEPESYDDIVNNRGRKKKKIKEDDKGADSISKEVFQKGQKLNAATNNDKKTKKGCCK